LATEITNRPEYDLEPRQVETQWVVDILLSLLEWVIAPFRWIYNLTEGLPEFLRVLLVLALLVVLIAIVAHIIYSLATAIRGGDRKLQADTPRRGIEPSEWERRASAAAASGDYITAVRHLFRAALGRLELVEKKPFRPGITNRELVRRYRSRGEIAAGLQLFVDTIDRKWYGGEVCSEGDYAVCRAAHADVRRAATGGAHAVDA
jgi:hypothetical protein